MAARAWRWWRRNRVYTVRQRLLVVVLAVAVGTVASWFAPEEAIIYIPGVSAAEAQQDLRDLHLIPLPGPLTPEEREQLRREDLQRYDELTDQLEVLQKRYDEAREKEQEYEERNMNAGMESTVDWFARANEQRDKQAEIEAEAEPLIDEIYEIEDAAVRAEGSEDIAESVDRLKRDGAENRGDGGDEAPSDYSREPAELPEPEAVEEPAAPTGSAQEPYIGARPGPGLFGWIVGIPLFGGALFGVLAPALRERIRPRPDEDEPETIEEAVAAATARETEAPPPGDPREEPDADDPPEDGPEKPRRDHSGSESGGLKKYAVNMTERARAGTYEPMVGREEELRRTIRVLAQRKSNCPVLIGEAGVGKTSIVQGLAQRIAAGHVPEQLVGKEVWELDLTALKSGASYVGQLEGRLKSVLDDVRDRPEVILFVDEIHRLIGAGSHAGEKDVGGNAIKRPLTDGELQIIGATTTAEYREIERDPALARRFQTVSVPPLTIEQTVEVLYRVRGAEEAHHGVQVSYDALEAAAKLADRYIKDRQLPAAAVDVLANACAEAALAGEGDVTARHVTAAISEATGVPVGDIGTDEREKMERLDEAIKSRVIGQDAAAEILAEAVRRKRAGFGAGRPVSALFAGSTGTGKTETAKALAEALFGDEDAMIRLDMSEYQEPHSISRLIGSPPGYRGSEEGGRLTEAVRRKPYSVVLFDEIEKAHPDVFNILLQMLDDGRLTDARGTTVDFANTVVILTSNLAAREIGQLYLSGEEVDERRVKDLLVGEYGMKPELANRMGAIVPFRPLAKEHMERIARLMVGGVAKSMHQEHGVSLTVEDDAVAWLSERGYEPESGARPLRNLIERELENPLASILIAGKVGSGDTVRVTVNRTGDALAIRGEKADREGG